MRNGQCMKEPEGKRIFRSTVFEQTFASTSTHSLDSIDPAVESHWAILSLPLSSSSLSFLLYSLPFAFALLWQGWKTPIVLGTLRPPRQTSSLFLSQSLSWSSSSSVCPQSQSRHILHTPHYHVVHLHIFSPEEMQAQWEPTGSDLTPLRARRQEQKHQELLVLALGLRLGVKDTLLWKPIKLLACSQISNSPLGRRSALKDGSEKQCNYEKVHNFKVSPKQIQL